MENKTIQEIREAFRLLTTIENHDVDYDEVSGKQIISALNKNMGLSYAKEYMYQVQQGVANEARRRNLLINPNPFQRETYSSAVGNTNRMLPSLMGWEQTKGIQRRHFLNATMYLHDLLLTRERSWTGPQNPLPVRGR